STEICGRECPPGRGFPTRSCGRGSPISSPFNRDARGLTQNSMCLLKNRALAAGLVLFIGAQFVPVETRKPLVNPSQTVYAFHPMRENVRAMVARSCSQCHSDETRWPWYSHVAPFSWIVAHDVNAGRRELNFSEWGKYQQEKREEKLTAICEQV